MIKNIPTKELAGVLGTTPGFASQIKVGRRPLPIKYCRLLHERYGIPMHELRPDVYSGIGG